MPQNDNDNDNDNSGMYPYNITSVHTNRKQTVNTDEDDKILDVFFAAAAQCLNIHRHPCSKFRHIKKIF